MIRTFKDAPDPFSPSLVANTLTATFQVREKGELRHEKEETQFFLEFVEIIRVSGATGQGRNVNVITETAGQAQVLQVATPEVTSEKRYAGGLIRSTPSRYSRSTRTAP